MKVETTRRALHLIRDVRLRYRHFCGRQVLVIREEGAKMPADLGGDIYGSINNRGDLEPVKGTIRQFVGSL